MLEGGGQLLRVALSLSSLTRIPIHVTSIRGKRGSLSSSGKDGGLKPAHLAAVKWLADATSAVTRGMEVKSRELEFKPIANSIELDKTGVQGVWKDVYEQGRIIRRHTHIPMSTPGSIPLVLQAMLPFILFSPSTVPLRITIEGGTNVSKSMSIEYLSQVLFPLLSSNLGIPPITATIHKRGWSVGRSDVGSVTFDITPLAPGSVLRAFEFSKRGAVINVYVSVLAPDEESRKNIKALVTARLARLVPESKLIFPIDEDSRSSQRLYLLLVAETSSGYRLGFDWLYEGTAGKRRKTREKKAQRNSEAQCAELVTKVVDDLEQELTTGSCVDEYLQDQLVVFQALAKGRSRVDGRKGEKATLHTHTVRWVVERILGAPFDEDGVCEGAGIKVGEGYSGGEGTEEEALVERVDHLGMGPNT